MYRVIIYGELKIHCQLASNIRHDDFYKKKKQEEVVGHKKKKGQIEFWLYKPCLFLKCMAINDKTKVGKKIKVDEFTLNAGICYAYSGLPHTSGFTGSTWHNIPEAL